MVVCILRLVPQAIPNRLLVDTSAVFQPNDRDQGIGMRPANSEQSGRACFDSNGDECAIGRLSAEQQAWRRFRAEGINVREWSAQRGFNPGLVYSVLRGERKCLRGQSHDVAVALGLKPLND